MIHHTVIAGHDAIALRDGLCHATLLAAVNCLEKITIGPALSSAPWGLGL
jgi:hypothetical protein